MTQRPQQQNKGSCDLQQLCNQVSNKLYESQVWHKMLKRFRNSVVKIFGKGLTFDPLAPHESGAHSIVTGTGFFVTDTHLLTNSHVVEDSPNLEIQRECDEKPLRAKLVALFPDKDIALLKVKDSYVERLKRCPVTPFQLKRSNEIERSQPVGALGFPLDTSGEAKMTVGIVSAFKRDSDRYYIEITTPINPGSSGGPALVPVNNDDPAAVIGITSRGQMLAQAVGFIIPSDVVLTASPTLWAMCTHTQIPEAPILGNLESISGPQLRTLNLPPPYSSALCIGSPLFPHVPLHENDLRPGDLLVEITVADALVQKDFVKNQGRLRVSGEACPKEQKEAGQNEREKLEAALKEETTGILKGSKEEVLERDNDPTLDDESVLEKGSADTEKRPAGVFGLMEGAPTFYQLAAATEYGCTVTNLQVPDYEIVPGVDVKYPRYDLAAYPARKFVLTYKQRGKILIKASEKDSWKAQAEQDKTQDLTDFLDIVVLGSPIQLGVLREGKLLAIRKRWLPMPVSWQKFPKIYPAHQPIDNKYDILGGLVFMEAHNQMARRVAYGRAWDIYRGKKSAPGLVSLIADLESESGEHDNDRKGFSTLPLLRISTSKAYYLQEYKPTGATGSTKPEEAKKPTGCLRPGMRWIKDGKTNVPIRSIPQLRKILATLIRELIQHYKEHLLAVVKDGKTNLDLFYDIWKGDPALKETSWTDFAQGLTGLEFHFGRGQKRFLFFPSCLTQDEKRINERSMFPTFWLKTLIETVKEELASYNEKVLSKEPGSTEVEVPLSVKFSTFFEAVKSKPQPKPTVPLVGPPSLEPPPPLTRSLRTLLS